MQHAFRMQPQMSSGFAIVDFSSSVRFAVQEKGLVVVN